MARRFRKLLIALLLAQSAAGQAQTVLPELGESAQADFTPQMERKVGEQIMRQIRRDPDFIADPEIASYIQNIGQRLVAVTPEARQEFEFFVVRDPSINAFAMPGGFIGVHSGLIVAAESESELAAVMGHEVAHVTQRHLARQLQKQSQVSMLSLAGLVLGLLAARSNPQAASAAMVGAQALPAATFLSYSRDFEREADRVGFTYLQQADFDVFGMPGFFERLQQAARVADSSAPGYMRTHPITSERIADMQNRVDALPVRQRRDSLEFRLVRAKLRAEQGRAEEAVAHYREVLRDKRYADEGVTRYGYAVALVRAADFRTAAAEVAQARKLLPDAPMIERLAAQVMAESGAAAGARSVYENALAGQPDNAGLLYGYAELLQRESRHGEALPVLDRLQRERPRDVRVHILQAKSHAALGRRFEQHRSLGEAYALQGNLPAAIIQLELAQLSGQGDFYALSAVDARVRELRKAQAEELAENRGRRLVTDHR